MAVPQGRDRAVGARLPERRSGISIVVPVLNDAPSLTLLLQDLQPWRENGHEVVVVDGGSTDGSLAVAYHRADQVLESQSGRAIQMNLGAKAATTDLFWFVHADSRLSPDMQEPLRMVQGRSDEAWGRFDIRLDNGRWPYRVIAMFMNIRSCLTGIATGDQGIFVTASLFSRIGGFPQIQLMEDIALSKALRKHVRPQCLKIPITTSARRWNTHGLLRTILQMWLFRLLYFFGVPPRVLHAWYYRQ